MNDKAALPRNLLVLAGVLPLAGAIGFLLATSQQFTSLLLLLLVGAALLSPIFLRWHHQLLVLSWCAGVNVFFLPGQPRVWMVLTCVSLGISVLNWLLDKQKRFLYAPAVTWSLVALSAVVLFTAFKTGGLGVRVFGSGVYGGKKYIEILVGVLGYFALAAQAIDSKRANLFMGLFLLSGITVGLSNFIYFLGPAFYWLYWIFPVEFVISQAQADFAVGDSLYRMNGIAFACLGPYLLLLARYGARGLLDLRAPWRLITAIVLVGVSLVSGFRSMFALMGLSFAVLFFLERLHRTKLFPAVILVSILAFVALMPISDKLPLSMQRGLSFLPFLEVNPIAKYNAQSSTEWRLEMWQLVLQDASKYWLVGKGYGINPTDLYLATQSVLRGLTPSDIDLTLLVGDYHNGPLSVYAAFGLPGTVAFGWFVVAAWRVLRANYRFGDPRLRLINTFLYGYFIARVIFFVLIFGAINADLFQFVGLVGLSLCFNQGVRRSEDLEERQFAVDSVGDEGAEMLGQKPALATT